MEIIMKNILDKSLALLTITLLISGFMLLGAKAFAQSNFILRFGTTLAEAKTVVDHQYQMLDTKLQDDTIYLENPYLDVIYSFDAGNLDHIRVRKLYKKAKLAQAGLDNYLIYLERIHGNVMPLVMEKNYTRYVVLTKDGTYTLSLRREGSSTYSLEVDAKCNQRAFPFGQSVAAGY